MLGSIRHIRGFLAVARLGSFTRASLELHVSQPALTIQIKQLEDELGVTLLYRNKREVALTRAGQELLEPLQRLVGEFESIVTSSRELAELRRGTITVAAMQSVAATILPKAIAEFSKSYPGISVNVIDSTLSLPELIKEGRVDFGIDGSIQRDRTVVVKNLFKEPMCVFTPLGHPLAGRRSVTLKELSKFPTILPQKNSNLGEILDRALQAEKIAIPSPHENKHISTTIGMVSAGLGIAVLPRGVLDCFPLKSICCIPITKPVLERQVVIVARASRLLPVPVQKLISILHDTAKQHLADPIS